MNKLNKKSIIILTTIIVVIVMVVMGVILFSRKEINNEQKETPYINDNVNDIGVQQKYEEKLKPKSITASVPIFMYHFVRDDTGDYEYPENMVKPETLRAQLQYIKDNGYETIYKDDIGRLEYFNKPVWLTFDDGWEDFYLNAFPLFKEYNMKASYYVITDLIGTPGYVKLEQLKEMKESGLIDIQSHTVTHPRLATLNASEVYNELSESKKFLKENLEIESNVICYPYGSYDDNVISISKEVGYQYGLAMSGGVYHSNKHINVYQIPRIYANRSMSIDTFASYIKQSRVYVEW